MEQKTVYFRVNSDYKYTVIISYLLSFSQLNWLKGGRDVYVSLIIKIQVWHWWKSLFAAKALPKYIQELLPKSLFLPGSSES